MIARTVYAQKIWRDEGTRYVYMVNKVDMLSVGNKEGQEARKILPEMDREDTDVGTTDPRVPASDNSSVSISPQDVTSETQASSASKKRPYPTEPVHEPNPSNSTRQSKKSRAQEVQMDYKTEILKLQEQVRRLEEVVEGLNSAARA